MYYFLCGISAIVVSRLVNCQVKLFFLILSIVPCKASSNQAAQTGTVLLPLFCVNMEVEFSFWTLYFYDFINPEVGQNPEEQFYIPTVIRHLQTSTVSCCSTPVLIKTRYSSRWTVPYLIDVLVGFDKVDTELAEWGGRGVTEVVWYARLHGLYVRGRPCGCCGGHGCSQLLLGHQPPIQRCMVLPPRLPGWNKTQNRISH